MARIRACRGVSRGWEDSGSGAVVARIRDAVRRLLRQLLCLRLDRPGCRPAAAAAALYRYAARHAQCDLQLAQCPADSARWHAGGSIRRRAGARLEHRGLPARRSTYGVRTGFHGDGCGPVVLRYRRGDPEHRPHRRGRRLVCGRPRGIRDGACAGHRPVRFLLGRYVSNVVCRRIRRGLATAAGHRGNDRCDRHGGSDRIPRPRHEVPRRSRTARDTCIRH